MKTSSMTYKPFAGSKLNKFYNELPFDLGEGKLLRVADKSLMICLDNYGIQHIPKGQIHTSSDVYYVDKHKQGYHGKVIVRHWFAKKAKWIISDF